MATGVSFFAYQKLASRRSKVVSVYPEVFKKKLIALDDDELRALKNYRDDTKQFLLVVSIVFGLAFWWGTYQPMQVKRDLELQSKSFAEKIPEGWQFICDDIFENFIGDGTYLYANGNSYDKLWCESLMTTDVINKIIADENIFSPSEYSDPESAAEKGFNTGARFAIDSVFSRVPYLCFGEDCINDVTIWDYYMESSRDTWYP